MGTGLEKRRPPCSNDCWSSRWCDLACGWLPRQHALSDWRANVPPVFQRARRVVRTKIAHSQTLRKTGLVPTSSTVVTLRRRLARRRTRKCPDTLTTRNPGNLERNTGFEPATFALATRQPGIHEAPLPSTNQHEPVISLGSSDSTAERSSTNLHAGSRISCAQRVPRSGRSATRPSLDVVQVAALLGCSTAHVYLLCEQGKLPHSRDIRNAISIDCRLLGRVLNLTPERPIRGNPKAS